MPEGRRVGLRALDRADAKRGHRWIDDGQVREFLHGMRYPVAMEDEERWLKGATRSSFSRVALAIGMREGVHVGNAELRGVSAEDRRGELGILIR